MFKALKLNPFSTPSDTKLTFRANHLPRLYTSTVPHDEHAYWSLYYTLFETTYDVLNLLPSHDISRALQAHPENIVTLIQVLSDRLEEILHDASFPTPPPEGHSLFASGLAAYKPTFLSGKTAEAGSNKPDLTKELLNCLRVLSRVIPFVLAHKDGSLEQSLFWAPTSTERRRNTGTSQEESSHFVIDDEEEDETAQTTTAGTNAGAGSAGKPLAERLLDSSIDLLFVHGFTLPPPTQHNDKKISYTIWENGIGSTLSVPSTREVDNNRIDVLRFLLSILSKTLYVPSSAYTAAMNLNDTHPSAASSAPPSFNKWHAYLVRSPSGAKARKITLSLLCSMLNVALKSGASQAASSQTLVSTVGDAVGDSYEKLVSGGKRKMDSPRLALVKTCVQVLNALICTPTSEILGQAIQAEQSRRGHNGNTAPQEANNVRSPPLMPATARSVSYFGNAAHNAMAANESNAFLFFLSKLHRESDLAFIAENILVILLQPMNTSFLKLPLEAVGVASSSSPTMATDFLTLLWKLVDCNPKFTAKLLSTEKNVHQIMGVLVYSCLEYKDKPAHLGLVKLAAFLLQTLSAEPAFGSSLNNPLSRSVPMPAKYSIEGSALDFLIQHLYTLIFSTKGILNAIYPAFILTIDNISPYMKNPTIKTSTRLIQLFLAISNPGFLLSDEANPRLVFYLLEAFNNVIQFQLRECPNLVYAIVRSHVRFEQLANFTVVGGVASIRKRRKERRAGVPTTHTPPKTPRRMSVASEALVPVPTPGLEQELSEQVAQRIEDQEKAALAQQDQLRQLSRESRPDSPLSEYPPAFTSPRISMSEKAAGKQRARSMSQSSFPPGSLNASHADLTSLYSEGGEVEEGPYVSKSGFMPTEGWVASWREGLPIDGILILVSECLSKISSISSLSPGSNSAAVEKYLRSVDLTGLLPPMPPVRPRPFQTASLHSILWIMSLSWGNVYVQSLENTSLNNGLSNWRDTNVRLFNVRHSPGGGLAGGVGQVQAAMSSLVEQGLGMLNLGGPPSSASSPRTSMMGQPRRSVSRNSFGVV